MVSKGLAPTGWNVSSPTSKKWGNEPFERILRQEGMALLTAQSAQGQYTKEQERGKSGE
jgi:hypothetical protein